MANISNELRMLRILYKDDRCALGKIIMLTPDIFGTVKATGGTAYGAHSNRDRGHHTKYFFDECISRLFNLYKGYSMKENIDNLLKLVKPKNDRELFVVLTYIALIFFETDNYEGIEYLAKDYCGQMISEGQGFSSSNNKFSPSVVEFGELTGFMLEDIEKIKFSKITKDEARKAILRYLKNYFFF